jgi:hypothetical protein
MPGGFTKAVGFAKVVFDLLKLAGCRWILALKSKRNLPQYNLYLIRLSIRIK